MLIKIQIKPKIKIDYINHEFAALVKSSLHKALLDLQEKHDLFDNYSVMDL